VSAIQEFTKSGIERGRQNSHRKLPKTCIDCGQVFEVSVNVYKRSVRCPACRAEHERRRKRIDYYDSVRPYKMTRIDGNWRIIVDPDESWGYNSHLRYNEIRHLLRLGYIVDGTTFLNTENNCIYEVISGKLKKRK